jgi:hypothetical protein
MLDRAAMRIRRRGGGEPPTTSGLPRGNLPIADQPYSGPVADDAKDPESVFAPIEPLCPPAGAPDVLVLLDDRCFGASSTFGGPCAAPVINGRPHNVIGRPRSVVFWQITGKQQQEGSPESHPCWWARQGLNLPPLPCQKRRGSAVRIAVSPRSPPTVHAEVMRSLGGSSSRRPVAMISGAASVAPTMQVRGWGRGRCSAAAWSVAVWECSGAELVIKSAAV